MIAHPCRWPALFALCEGVEINEIGEPLRHAMLRNRTLSMRAADEHDELIALLRKNAVAEAIHLMRRHILASIPDRPRGAIVTCRKR